MEKLTDKDVTPYRHYLNRRAFMAGLGAGVLGAIAGPAFATPIATAKTDKTTDEKQTSLADITSYNNFYEFGVDKSDPAANAHTLTTSPWPVAIGGLCAKAMTLDAAELMTLAPQEDRIYRHRCVEGWSMVIPWVGYSLSKLIEKAQPTSAAKYVAFETVYRPTEMPGQRGLLQPLDWPYVEGLRLDEAMHPLTLLCFGLYGDTLPKQDGAPVRIVVPWKYGFKSIKSLVKITFTDKEPPTSWNRQAPSEYGFYSNVNPEVDHPRWSQAKERRIGELFKRPTLMFNGYGDQVASLYTGMDLRKNF